MAIEHVESIQRCTDVLRVISAGGGINISELARKTGISRAAVNRFVVSLEELGYIYGDPRTHEYKVTSKTRELSNGVSRDEQIRLAVLPVLQKTCREIGWSLSFTSIRNAQLTLIAHTDAVSPLIPRRRGIMLLRPLLGTAGGHVLLAHLPDEIRQDILAMAHLVNPALYEEAGVSEDSIDSLLERVRADRFAMVTVDRRHMNVLAVPVHVGDGVPFSVSAGIYDTVVPADQVVERFAGPLSQCASEISTRLVETGADLIVGAPLHSESGAGP